MQEIIGTERSEEDEEVAESKGSLVEEEAVDHGLQVSQFVESYYYDYWQNLQWMMPNIVDCFDDR